MSITYRTPLPPDGKGAERPRQRPNPGRAQAGPGLDPRASNHGGHTPPPTPRVHVDAGVRFDWYQATFDGPVDDEGHVPWALGAALSASASAGTPRHGYGVCTVLHREGRVVAQVYERSARHGEVHVLSSSDACDEVVPLLRDRYPGHRVSRADSAIDLRLDFDALDRQVLAFAVERAISHRFITDSSGGATRYLGAPSSESRLRVYKKTEQLRALHPDVAHEIPDGIVRAEIQVRPGKRDAKERLGRSPAGDVWGFSQWSSDLAALVLGLDAERAPTHFRRPTDWQRQLHWLGRQYGPAVRGRVSEVGLMEALAEVLGAFGLAPVTASVLDPTPACCAEWRRVHYVGITMGGTSALFDAACPLHKSL